VFGIFLTSPQIFPQPPLELISRFHNRLRTEYDFDSHEDRWRKWKEHPLRKAFFAIYHTP
jgi:hypothetical protein